MDFKIPITIDTENNTVRILTGEALAPEKVNAVAITGDIFTPGVFFTHHKDSIPPNAYVVFNKYDDVPNIELIIDAHREHGTTVLGYLTVDDSIEKIGINTDQRWASSKSLAKHLKRFKPYFNSPTEFLEVIEKLNDLEIKVNAQLNAKGDERANKKVVYDKAVETNLPDSFTINGGIFRGCEPKSYLVDLCFDERDGGISIWLDSIELSILKHNQALEIMESQLIHFDGIVIINS